MIAARTADINHYLKEGCSFIPSQHRFPSFNLILIGLGNAIAPFDIVVLALLLDLLDVLAEVIQLVCKIEESIGVVV